MKKRILAAALSAIMLFCTAASGFTGTTACAETSSSFAKEFRDASYESAKFRVRYWITAGWSGKDAYHLAEIDREMKEMADAGYSTVELADVHDMMSQTEKDKLGEIDENGSSYLYGSEKLAESAGAGAEVCQGIRHDGRPGVRLPLAGLLQ